ncbi:MAG: hypothetical protein JXN59_19475 [Anaerolineae bacterium]|nr:hypothetical protein [Anaerolineae bacterium]
MAKMLLRKLLIKPGMTVAVVGAPEEYLELLGELPECITLTHALDG